MFLKKPNVLKANLIQIQIKNPKTRKRQKQKIEK